MYTVTELILCERLSCEELLHECVISFSYNFVDLVLKVIDSLVVFFGKRIFNELARCLVDVESLAVHNIDDTCHLAVLHDRERKRDD